MSDEERRRDLRAKLKWRVLAKEKGAVIDGVTKDISTSGDLPPINVPPLELEFYLF